MVLLMEEFFLRLWFLNKHSARALEGFARLAMMQSVCRFATADLGTHLGICHDQPIDPVFLDGWISKSSSLESQPFKLRNTFE